jgi:hypothetical protein
VPSESQEKGQMTKNNWQAKPLPSTQSTCDSSNFNISTSPDLKKKKKRGKKNIALRQQ